MLLIPLGTSGGLMMAYQVRYLLISSTLLIFMLLPSLITLHGISCDSICWYFLLKVLFLMKSCYKGLRSSSLLLFCWYHHVYYRQTRVMIIMTEGSKEKTLILVLSLPFLMLIKCQECFTCCITHSDSGEKRMCFKSESFSSRLFGPYPIISFKIISIRLLLFNSSQVHFSFWLLSSRSWVTSSHDPPLEMWEDEEKYSPHPDFRYLILYTHLMCNFLYGIILREGWDDVTQEMRETQSHQRMRREWFQEEHPSHPPPLNLYFRNLLQ